MSDDSSRVVTDTSIDSVLVRQASTGSPGRYLDSSTTAVRAGSGWGNTAELMQTLEHALRDLGTQQQEREGTPPREATSGATARAKLQPLDVVDATPSNGSPGKHALAMGADTRDARKATAPSMETAPPARRPPIRVVVQPPPIVPKPGRLFVCASFAHIRPAHCTLHRLRWVRACR